MSRPTALRYGPPQWARHEEPATVEPESAEMEHKPFSGSLLIDSGTWIGTGPKLAHSERLPAQ